MTNEQKILFTLLLIVMVGGAAWYVNNESNNSDTNIYTSSNSNNTNSNNTASVNSVSNTNSATQNTNTVNTTNTSDATSNQNTNSNTSNIKTASKTITFQVPEGHTDNFTVNVTLNGKTITDISFSQDSSNRESREYADKFSSKFSKSLVIGKDISSINLSRVGGASLTTGAFNNAINQIANNL